MDNVAVDNPGDYFSVLYRHSIDYDFDSEQVHWINNHGQLIAETIMNNK